MQLLKAQNKDNWIIGQTFFWVLEGDQELTDLLEFEWWVTIFNSVHSIKSDISTLKGADTYNIAEYIL